MSTLYQQRADLCVSGYVRSGTKIMECNIPPEIIRLILLFYLLKIEIEMIFDKDNVGTDIEILSDHKIKFSESCFVAFVMGYESTQKRIQLNQQSLRGVITQYSATIPYTIGYGAKLTVNCHVEYKGEGDDNNDNMD